MEDNHEQEQESFLKKDFRKTRTANQAFGFRALAILVVLYMLFQVIQGYIAGGEDAPSLTLLILSIVLLGGGAAAIGILSYIQWKRDQKAAALTKEEQARMDALRAEDEATEE